MDTMKNYADMDNMEIRQRMDELAKILDWGISEDWDDAYSEYFKLADIMRERYRKSQQNAFDAFYEKHIKGKTWEEIDPEDWSWYSDWHKDMYGFRPKYI